MGVSFGVVSVLGLSVGTLGQRWIGHAPDPLWSATIQFGVAAPPLLVLALLVEGTDVVRDPAAAGLSLVYLAAVNSIVGLGLLGILVRARGAGATGSVLPDAPVTAVIAWVLLGETLDPEVVGLVITVAGVAAATRNARRWTTSSWSPRNPSPTASSSPRGPLWLLVRRRQGSSGRGIAPSAGSRQPEPPSRRSPANQNCPLGEPMPTRTALSANSGRKVSVVGPSVES